MKIKKLLLIALLIFARVSFAEESHSHDEHEHEEVNPQVGSEKGILEASEEQGIKLSPEAEKNFEVKRMRLSSNGAFEIPRSAIVTAGTEVNLFRFRNGFYKRIDFIFLSKKSDKAVVSSKDLKVGDEIALTGQGFLRIAEIAAFGGAPEGHSH
jgi:hypothetical protein